MTTEPLLEVNGLHVRFPLRSGLMQRVTGDVNAVSGADFAIPRGEAYGLVGESGCGKTTVARAVLQLIRPSAGTIRFDGEDLTAMSPAQLAPFRRRVQAIFQDPFSSLNPRMTAGDILVEPIRVHRFVPPREISQGHPRGHRRWSHPEPRRRPATLELHAVKLK